jgi:hypothetical protein
LAAPRQWLLLLAPLAVNGLSARPLQYSFEGHYSAFLIPFLFLTMIMGYLNIRERWTYQKLPFRAAAAGFFVLMVGLGLLRQKPYFHRVSLAKMRAGREICRSVPPDDPIQASWNVVPQLSLRRHIRLFGDLRPVRWVVLDADMTGYSPPPEYVERMARFVRSNRHRLFCVKENFLVYRYDGIPSI